MSLRRPIETDKMMMTSKSRFYPVTLFFVFGLAAGFMVATFFSGGLNGSLGEQHSCCLGRATCQSHRVVVIVVVIVVDSRPTWSPVHDLLQYGWWRGIDADKRPCYSLPNSGRTCISGASVLVGNRTANSATKVSSCDRPSWKGLPPLCAAAHLRRKAIKLPVFRTRKRQRLHNIRFVLNEPQSSSFLPTAFGPCSFSWAAFLSRPKSLCRCHCFCHRRLTSFLPCLSYDGRVASTLISGLESETSASPLETAFRILCSAFFVLELAEPANPAVPVRPRGHFRFVTWPRACAGCALKWRRPHAARPPTSRFVTPPGAIFTRFRFARCSSAKRSIFSLL